MNVCLIGSLLLGPTLPPLLQNTRFTHTHIHAHGRVSRWNLTDKAPLLAGAGAESVHLKEPHWTDIHLTLLLLLTLFYLCLLTLSLRLAHITGLTLCIVIPNDINLDSVPCYLNFQSYSETKTGTVAHLLSVCYSVIWSHKLYYSGGKSQKVIFLDIFPGSGLYLIKYLWCQGCCRLPRIIKASPFFSTHSK